MADTQIILTSGTTWVVPADWNNAANKIECIGAGAAGQGTSGYSGGGGAYARKNNLALTPGGTVSYQVGTPSATSSVTNSWLNSTSTVKAAGATGMAGASAASCVGDLTYSGGTGATGGTLGGGGAAGPNGAGGNPSGNTGGVGDAGFGGAGGRYNFPEDGGNGTEWGATAGSGGGGGSSDAVPGGKGGKYGGGGGWSISSTGGLGRQGVIVITYTPLATTSPIAGSTTLTIAVAGTALALSLIAGSTGITTAAAATLSGAGALAGTTSLALSTTGMIGEPGQTIGATSLAFDSSGTLSASGALAGATSLTFAGSLIPGEIAAISGTTAIQFGLSGYLLNPVHAVGSTSLSLTTTGTMSARVAAAGSTSLAYAMSGTLTNSVGRKFINLFVNVYTAKQALLNAMSGQTLTTLANIASDNLLSAGEKSTVIRDVNVINGDQAGIDAKATAYGITTELTAYNGAITSLNAYLATLTAPKLWSDVSGDTTIVGTTFRANFGAVYAAKQTLINAIVAAAKALADGAQATANTGLSLAQQQGVLDPNFANGLTYWTPDAANQGWYAENGVNSPNPNITTYAIHAGSTANPPNTTGTQTTALRSVAFVPVTPGQLVSCTAQIKPAGSPTGYANARISWRNAAQGEISVSQGSNITTTTGTSRLPPTAAPAGAVYAHVEVAVYNHTTGYYNFSAVSWNYNPASQDEVPDSATYGRTSQNDLYVSGGVNRVGLRVPGSGQVLGDQLNAPNSLTLNYGAARTTTAVTASSTGAVSINAFSVNMGGTTVSYSAVSNAITGLTQNVTYQIYCHDLGGTGGTKTWLAVAGTANALLTLGDDVVLAGQVTIPTSGTSGGGGGGYCVCDDMMIDADTLAGEAPIGYLFDCLDIPTQGMRKFRRRLQSVEYTTVACVRVTTDAGATLECSTTTPFDVLDGRTVYAPDMLGEQVVTDKGIETVARVDDIGERRVCHIHLGGVSYAAGADPAHRIYSHNLKP